MTWSWKRFSELTVDELYAIIRLRERVFVLEQNCVYLDCDDCDQKAWHLLGYQDGVLVAYLRAFPPGVKYAESSFGRVVTAPEARKQGLGKILTAEGIRRLRTETDGAPIRVSAQAYLKRFYSGFGFEAVGGEYLEDGIPHIEMVLR